MHRGAPKANATLEKGMAPSKNDAALEEMEGSRETLLGDKPGSAVPPRAGTPTDPKK
jgi:hypothetical protein